MPATPGQLVLFQTGGALPESGGMFVYDPDSDSVKPLPAPPETWNFFLGPHGLYVPYSISPDSRWVAYIGKEHISDPWRIYIAALDGTVMTKPTLPLVNARDVDSLAWSPDGSKLAYLAITHAIDWSSYKADVHVIDVDGGNARKLSADDYVPAIDDLPNIRWSPDGRYVAYRLAKNDGSGYVNFGVDVVDVSDGARNRLELPSISDRIGYFAWSPDGSQLAYTVHTEGAAELYTARPDGGDASSIGVTWHPVYPQRFEWSPDSTRLAFTTKTLEGTYGVFVATLDGSGPVRIDDQLGPGVAVMLDSLWSPDGSRLAWLAPGPGGAYANELYTARADGTDRRRVSVTQPGDNWVSLFKWSPDGTQIAYEVWIDAHAGSKLYVVGADGSSPLEVNAFLTSNPQEYRKGYSAPPETPRLKWSPDGSRLAYVAVLDVPRAELFTVRNDLTENFKLNEPLFGDPLTFRFAQFAWSNDGSRLAYQGDEDGDGRVDVYVVAPNGAAYRNISRSVTGDSASVVRFFWSP